MSLRANCKDPPLKCPGTKQNNRHGVRVVRGTQYGGYVKPNPTFGLYPLMGPALMGPIPTSVKYGQHPLPPWKVMSTRQSGMHSHGARPFVLGNSTKDRMQESVAQIR